MAASNTITVDELMEQFRLTEEQCNCEITDAHLGEISRNFVANWRSLVSQVGMPRNSKSDIERNFITEEERRDAFLFQWKRRNGHTATYKRLISALLAIDDRADAEGVCDMLAKSTHPQQEMPNESSLNSVAENQANSMVTTMNQENQRHQLTASHDERHRSFVRTVEVDFIRNNEDSSRHEQNLTFMVPTAVVKGAVSGAIIGALAVGAGLGLVYTTGSSAATQIVYIGFIIAVMISIGLLPWLVVGNVAADGAFYFALAGGVAVPPVVLLILFVFLDVSHLALSICAGVVSLCAIGVLSAVTGSANEALAIVIGMWLQCLIGVVGVKVGATAKALAIGAVMGLLLGGITGRVKAAVATSILILETITFIYILASYH